MPEILKELNQNAIKNSLLLPDGQSLRKDYSPLLGKELTQAENRCYKIIVEHAPDGPVSTDTIYRDLFHAENNYSVTKLDHNLVWLYICRIKQKLGKDELISRRGLGYQSRRALNRLSVPRKN